MKNKDLLVKKVHFINNNCVCYDKDCKCLCKNLIKKFLFIKSWLTIHVV